MELPLAIVARQVGRPVGADALPFEAAPAPARRHKRAGDSDFLVGSMRVLIAAEKEELILLDRQSDRSSRGVAVQTGFFSLAGIFGSALKKYGSAFSQLVPRCT